MQLLRTNRSVAFYAWHSNVAKSITFDDGTVVRGESDAELVRAAEAHIRGAHPTLAGRLSREEILAMAIQTEEREGSEHDDERRL